MRLYLNGQTGRKKLENVRSRALSELRAPAQANPRMQMNRLDQVAVGELIAGYRAGAKINELARKFAVHRTTVSSLLRRHLVELR